MTRRECVEERKIVCGCACDKRQGRTSGRPHRNILRHFNWSILEEERVVGAAEAFVLICAWLRRLGGGVEQQIKLKDPQSDTLKKKAFCNISVDLQSFPGFISMTSPLETVWASLLKQQQFQNCCQTFHMFKWRALTKRLPRQASTILFCNVRKQTPAS